MSYFGFLAIFLGIPIIVLSALTLYDWWRGRWQPQALHNWQPWIIIIAHCFIAVAYTFLWDNYLVATGVWYYDVALVSGIIIWYVPIEEYTFFVLQPIMIGLFCFWIMRHMPINKKMANQLHLRILSAAFVGILWIGSVAILASGWKPATYLGLLLVWALPPIILQLGFGADILWRHRWIVAISIILPTLYFSWADSLAITAGTWTIAPDQSLGILLAGILPIEEALFFLMTNILIVFGSTLMIAEESLIRSRLNRIKLLRQKVEEVTA